MTGRTVAVLTALATFSILGPACNRSQPRTSGMPENQLGVYQFSERISEANPVVVLEGTISVTRDTIDVTMSTNPCRYDPSSGAAAIRYRCADVTVSVDRFYPSRSATYYLSLVVRQPVRTCVRYQTTTEGRQCIQYATTYQDRRVSRSGRFELTRVDH